MTMIKTRLTEQFKLRHPIIQAPMAIAGGGKLAAAVCKAGGLGLIGGGYCDKEWIENQFNIAHPEQVGCGFITWSLTKQPELLQSIIERKPRAIFLSFGNPSSFTKQIKNANIPLICQIQTLRDAKSALDLGADIIVAQGSEAGGHGQKRTTFTIVPEVADYIAVYHPQALLCAAGGIADGRGLCAALMLGADGVVIGSRFWATNEALVHPNMHSRAIQATGDESMRTSIMDIARKLDWPSRYTARALENQFIKKWHHRPDQLKEVADTEAKLWKEAWLNGNTDIANTFVGECTGIINNIGPVEEYILSISDEARAILNRQWV